MFFDEVFFALSKFIQRYYWRMCFQRPSPFACIERKVGRRRRRGFHLDPPPPPLPPPPSNATLIPTLNFLLLLLLLLLLGSRREEGNYFYRSSNMHRECHTQKRIPVNFHFHPRRRRCEATHREERNTIPPPLALLALTSGANK